MQGRDQLFADAISIVTSGGSIDVVGDRGAGRSTFLERIRNHFLNEHWFVLSVAAVPAFKNFPLTALAVAGVAAAREGRPNTIAASVEEIVSKVRQGRGAIVVDDWDDLDDASWGVITSAQRKQNIPVIISRVRAAEVHRNPGGLGAGNMSSIHTLALPSLRHDELDDALAVRLGAPLEPSALSRVYAKTGGNVGLAFALVDSAVREQRLENRDGSWVATRDLWSNTLVTMVESLLEPLTTEQRDALEVLSLLGVVDVETVEPIVTPTMIEELERQSLLELYPAGGQFLVNVTPPLVVEYFRHVSHPARRLRLTHALQDDLMLARGVETIPTDADQTAGFVRFVHEQRRTRLLVARSDWTRTPSRRTAVEYIRALVAAAGRVEEIDEVFSASEAEPADDTLLAEWHLLKGEHIAYEHHDPEGAVASLRSTAATLGRKGAILLARAVEIEDAFIGNGDLTTLPPIDDHYFSTERAAIHRAHAFVLTAQGDIAQSRAHIEALKQETEEPLDPTAAMIAGVNDLSDGRLRRAAENAALGMEDARERFDPVAMRVHGHIAVAAGVLDGRFTDVERVLDTMYALGEPFHEPPFTQLAFDVTSAVIAARRGYKRLVQQRVADFERNPLPDGSWVGTARGYAYAQIAASAGDFPKAADILDEMADRLWSRGARVSAMVASLVAIELAPSPDRLATAAERVELVPAELVQTHYLFATAVASGEPDLMLAAGEELASRERLSMALIAFRAAADLLAESGDRAGAENARARFEALREGLTPDDYDVERFKTVVVELTAREREIAEMVTSGMSNQQIAAALTLSVRTVETHMHRLMRKTGAGRRSELGEYLEPLNSR